MPPPSSSIEDQIQQLTRRLAGFEARLIAIEQGTLGGSPPPTAGDVPAAPVASSGPASLTAAIDPLRVVTNLGRSLIILGGAFLLRAITDSSFIPPSVGVPLGLIYALTWIGSAIRTGGRGDLLRAAFDGATALIIGYPLVVEATLRFRLFTPPVAAFALGALTAIALVAAWRRTQQPLAGMAVIGGLATGLTLMVRTGVVASFSLYFTALGVGTLWLSYIRGWKILRWPTGVVAAFVVLGLTSRALGKEPLEPPAQALAAQALLLGAYLGSIAVRTLVRGRQVIVFEVVQTVLVLIVGLGGLLYVIQTTGAGRVALGAFVFGLGVAAYAVAFQFLARQATSALNFYFYSALALIFVLVGTGTLLAGTARDMAFTAAGLLLAGAWLRSARVTLDVHTTLALGIAAAGAGLLSLARAAWVGALPAPDVPVWPAAVVLAAVVGVGACRIAEWADPWPAPRAVPALALGALAAFGSAGLATLLVVRVTEAAIAMPVTPEVLETARTAVLSFVVLGATALTRPDRWSTVD